MTTQEHFYVRDTRSLGVDPECPVCGDRLSLTNFAVFDGNNEPLCDLCAWERAPELASLVNLNAAAHYHNMGGVPDDVFRAMEKRRADTKRIKRKLQDALARPDGWEHNSLREVLKGQIKAALDSGKVETMRRAHQLVFGNRTQPPTLRR